jgi:hypothetical protein
LLAAQLVKAGLGFVPFRVLRRLLPGLAWTLRYRVAGRAVPGARVAWAVEVASRRTVGRATCLVEALVAQVVLAAQGHPSQLQFGVARSEAGGVRAHAWVESDGRVVIGGPVRDSERYVQLIARDSEAR